MNRTELVNKFSNDVKRIENIIKHRNIYNARNFAIRALIKSGIAIDYALPFILMGIIVAHLQTLKGDAPFHIDEITEKANIETIDTSSGKHLEYISYDNTYSDESLEYSTSWVINENGLYERTITSYRLNDEIDLSDTQKVLSMSKEEVEDILVITNIKTIRKKSLDIEDKIYDESCLIITNHIESEEYTKTRMETSGENVAHSLFFIVLALSWGNSFRKIEKIFVKTYIRDRLRKYEPLFKRVSEEEIEIMKAMLKIKQENFAMLDESDNNIDEPSGRSYILRRI